MNDSHNTHYDVVGIGNAIIDILAHVDDAFLSDHEMNKGSMQLVDANTVQTLHDVLEESRICSGGSVANTMAGLASLDVSCAFIGRVANDEMGTLFSEDITKTGIAFHNAPATDGKPTACCVVCVTPDGERTMNTFIGASAELTRADIDEETIARSSYLYIEGYMWDAEAAKEAILFAIECAKKHDVTVAFTASDAFCVARHKESFNQLITDHVDVLFANEEEALALTDAPTAKEALVILGKRTQICAITRSEEPAFIYCEGDVLSVEGQAAQLVDTTGAGDLFAAGFLYGLVKNHTLTSCAQHGHALASHIIGRLGARSDESLDRLVA